jgi:hypothetical protein
MPLQELGVLCGKKVPPKAVNLIQAEFGRWHAIAIWLLLNFHDKHTRSIRSVIFKAGFVFALGNSAIVMMQAAEDGFANNFARCLNMPMYR